MLKAKGEVLQKIEDVAEMNQDTYHAIIKEILARYSNIKNVSKEEIAALEKELAGYWDKIKKEVHSDGKKAVKKVKKSAVKIITSTQ